MVLTVQNIKDTEKTNTIICILLSNSITGGADNGNKWKMLFELCIEII